MSYRLRPRFAEDAGAEGRDGTDDSSIEMDTETDSAGSRDAAEIDMDGAEGEVEVTPPLQVKATHPLDVNGF